MKEIDYIKATNIRTLRIMLHCARELSGFDSIISEEECHELCKKIALLEQRYEDKI